MSWDDVREWAEALAFVAIVLAIPRLVAWVAIAMGARP